VRRVPWAAGAHCPGHPRLFLFGRAAGFHGSAPCPAQRSRAVCTARLGARSGSGARVSTSSSEQGLGYPLRPPVGDRARGARTPVLQHRAVTSSIPCSMTSISSAKTRTSRSTRSSTRMGPAQMRSPDPRLPVGPRRPGVLFKRTAREAALRHKIYATFMAKRTRRSPQRHAHPPERGGYEIRARNL